MFMLEDRAKKDREGSMEEVLAGVLEKGKEEVEAVVRTLGLEGKVGGIDVSLQAAVEVLALRGLGKETAMEV